MKNVRLGNRVNRIVGKPGLFYNPMPSRDRFLMGKYQRKMSGMHAVRNIEIYCRYKHQQIDAKEIAKRFALKPYRVKSIYYKIAKQIKEWKDNG